VSSVVCSAVIGNVENVVMGSNHTTIHQSIIPSRYYHKLHSKNTRHNHTDENEKQSQNLTNSMLPTTAELLRMLILLPTSDNIAYIS
jgi:hypothetical protein